MPEVVAAPGDEDQAEQHDQQLDEAGRRVCEHKQDQRSPNDPSELSPKASEHNTPQIDYVGSSIQSAHKANEADADLAY